MTILFWTLWARVAHFHMALKTPFSDFSSHHTHTLVIFKCEGNLKEWSVINTSRMCPTAKSRYSQTIHLCASYFLCLNLETFLKSLCLENPNHFKILLKHALICSFSWLTQELNHGLSCMIALIMYLSLLRTCLLHIHPDKIVWPSRAEPISSVLLVFGPPVPSRAWSTRDVQGVLIEWMHKSMKMRKHVDMTDFLGWKSKRCF